MKKKLVFLLALISFFAVQSQIDAGDIFTKTGDWKRAIKAYSIAPSSAQKDFKIAQAYSQLGNLNKAIRFYVNGFSKDSISLKPRYEYGKLLINAQEFVDAVPVFKALIKSQPENATFHYYLGEAWSGFNQTNQAILCYEKAIQLNEDYRAARLELIKNYLQKREFVLAAKFANEGITMDPTDIKINSYLAQTYVNAKLYLKAIPVFERLFKLGNDTEYNRNGLAFSYYSNQQFEKAIENYIIFMKDYDDKEPSIHYNMSVAYMKLGKFSDAIDAIEKAITLKRPLLDREFIQLAAVYARNDDIKNAFFALKMAQKEKADDAMINYQLAIAADRYFKDKKTIIPYYEKYLEIHGEKSDYGPLAAQRLIDLKQAVFMNGDD